MSDRGRQADDALRAANLADVGVQTAIGFEKVRRLAQTGLVRGARAAGARAATLGRVYGRVSAPLSLGIEAANSVWLASDASKRERASAEFNQTAAAPAAARMVEGAINPSDTLFSLGKEVYDYGRTKESIERGRMDATNNALLRKIAAHEDPVRGDRAAQNRQSDIDSIAASLSPAPAPRPSLYDAWMRKAKTPMLKRR